MKKSIFFFAAVAALFSCAKENPTADTPVVDTPVVETPAEETFSVEIRATAPSDGDDAVAAHSNTKTTLVGGVDAEGNPKKFVYWSKGDAIKVLFFPDAISVNASFSGPNGIFTSHFDEETSSTAFFRCDSWSWGSKVEELGISKSLTEKGIAVYPARTATAKSTKPSGTRVICDTEVSFVLPSTQTAVKDNIESNLNFSYATVELSKFQSTISNGAQTDLKFNNACAMIELTMPSTLDKKITSISIASNNNVPLTGKGVATMSYYKNEIDSNTNDSASDHIFKAVISEGAGVTLNNANGFEAGAKYYVVVWPGKHDGGLTIEFVAEDGTKATKTTGGVELTASHVKPYSFNKGLVFESSTYDYVYSDGTFGNEVKSNIIGVVIYNGAPQDIDSGIPSKFSTGVAVYVDQYSTQWQSSAQIATSSFTSAGVALANSFSKSSVGGYTAKVNLLALNSSYLALYKGMPSFSYSFATELYVGTTKEWDIIAGDMERINSLLSAAGKTQISGQQWTANVASKLNSYYTTGNGAYSSGSATWTLATRPIFAF